MSLASSPRPLGHLMSELDGAAGDHPVFVLGTTNRLEAIEKAVRSTVLSSR